MNLMFWKKQPITEDSAEVAQEKPVDRTESPNTAAHESNERETSVSTQSESADPGPAHPQRLLIIVAAIGMLVLAAIGLASWMFLLPSPVQDTAKADVPAAVQTMALPEKNLIKLPPIEFLQSRKTLPKNHPADIEDFKENDQALQTHIEALKNKPPQPEVPQSINRQAEIDSLRKNNDELRTQIGAMKTELPRLEKVKAERHQADIDALTKKNSELQAQVDALRKNQPQRPSTSPASRPTGKAQPPARSGDLAIDSKSPKSTAMTLKEAIEAMNAGTGEPAKKAAK